MAQVAHVAHAALPVPALKAPEAQALHARSDEAPGAVVSYVPAAQTVTAVHTRSDTPETGAVDV